MLCVCYSLSIVMVILAAAWKFPLIWLCCMIVVEILISAVIIYTAMQQKRRHPNLCCSLSILALAIKQMVVSQYPEARTLANVIFLTLMLFLVAGELRKIQNTMYLMDVKDKKQNRSKSDDITKSR